MLIKHPLETMAHMIPHEYVVWDGWRLAFMTLLFELERGIDLI